MATRLRLRHPDRDRPARRAVRPGRRPGLEGGLLGGHQGRPVQGRRDRATPTSPSPTRPGPPTCRRSPRRTAPTGPTTAAVTPPTSRSARATCSPRRCSWRAPTPPWSTAGRSTSPAWRRPWSAAGGKVVTEFAPVKTGTLPVDPATLDYIRSAMMEVTGPDGTAKGAYASFPRGEIPVGGKTGTAEVAGKFDTSWFASFTEKPGAPRYVVVGMVTQAGTGGTVAAPMTRDIYSALYGLGRPAVAPVAGGALPTTLPVVAPDGSISAPAGTVLATQQASEAAARSAAGGSPGAPASPSPAPPATALAPPSLGGEGSPGPAPGPAHDLHRRRRLRHPAARPDPGRGEGQPLRARARAHLAAVAAGLAADGRRADALGARLAAGLVGDPGAPHPARRGPAGVLQAAPDQPRHRAGDRGLLRAGGLPHPAGLRPDHLRGVLPRPGGGAHPAGQHHQRRPLLDRARRRVPDPALGVRQGRALRRGGDDPQREAGRRERGRAAPTCSPCWRWPPCRCS